MVPFIDFERNVAEQPASSEGKIDECPFAFCVFFDFDRRDQAFERKQPPEGAKILGCLRRSMIRRVCGGGLLIEVSDPSF